MNSEGPIHHEGKHHASAHPTAARPRRRWKLILPGVVLLLLLGAELYCRFGLGLGDPPLMMVDTQIEYLYQPGKTYHRFGNRIHINQWSMRSDDFPGVKSGPDELRVLVIGDSVVNGGALTDQRDLATQRLQESLAQRLGRKVVVGNVSVGSWGPANQLAYLRRFGTFQADIVMFVYSSEDAADDPVFDPGLSHRPDFVTSRPPLALVELIRRYLLPRLGLGAAPGDPMGATTQPTRASLDAAGEAIDLVLESDAKVIIVKHYTTDELRAEQDPPGLRAFDEVCSTRPVRIIKLKQAFSRPDAVGVYRDYIHISAAGQKLLAEVLLEAILEQLAPPASGPAVDLRSNRH